MSPDENKVKRAIRHRSPWAQPTIEAAWRTAIGPNERPCPCILHWQYQWQYNGFFSGKVPGLFIFRVLKQQLSTSKNFICKPESQRGNWRNINKERTKLQSSYVTLPNGKCLSYKRTTRNTIMRLCCSRYQGLSGVLLNVLYVITTFQGTVIVLVHCDYL